MSNAVASESVRFNQAMTPLAESELPLQITSMSVEGSAFSELSALLLEAPERVPRRFLELTLQFCSAGTAGLSLLFKDAEGLESLRWKEIVGEMAEYQGRTVPRSFSLCGLALDAGSPLLIAQPERDFNYFLDVSPAINEALVVPLYGASNLPLGAIWVARHDSTTFTQRDRSLIERLAIQLSLAIKFVKLQEEHVATLIESADHKQQARLAAEELKAERLRRQVAERTEQSLHAELKFKDAATREIDHRAKNTLQVVANLLAVQSRQTTNVEARDVLQEAYRRLLLLARLHELLYMSGNDSREVKLFELFASIGDALRQSFGERRNEIQLELSVEPLVLSESVAIPLALLTNELVTNAYKHAFPSGSSGVIQLMLKQTAAGVILQVSDNGIGTQSAVEGSGLGQKLIRSFAEHLRGKVIYSETASGGGITATVTIAPRKEDFVARDTSESIATTARAM